MINGSFFEILTEERKAFTMKLYVKSLAGTGDKDYMKPPKRVSLWKKIISIFALTSTIPIVILCLFMIYTTTDILKKNTDSLMRNNIKQLNDNLNIQINAYEDVLYQLYTGDEIVEWVDKLNAEEDMPVTISQLRRYLRGILNSKDYIRSITIITESGLEVTYDCIATTTYANSWIENFSYSTEELYEEISSDNKLHVFPTEYGNTFANKDHYLFHMANRIIDYRDLDKQMGIVIVSLDEELLENILKSSYGNIGANILLDKNGRVISCNNKEKIGTVLFNKNSTEEEKKSSFISFVGDLLQINKKYISVYSYLNEELQWELVSAVNQSVYMKEIKHNAHIIVFVCLLLLFVTILLLWELSRQLINSINTVVSSMRVAGAGDLSTRIEISEKMPLEIESVALQFNKTLGKLVCALEKEKEATDKQRKAEIRALEAQINPHFLYNTLDTINWMAIDRGEFDISNAIGSLANILRYAITDSNGTVCIRDEIEWLKKYIYLQQFRLKNKFVRVIEVAPELLDVKIHKLLLQPFIENAIIHGFNGEQDEYILEVYISREKNNLVIIIRDNGSGMSSDLVNRINNGQTIKTEGKNHIGMDNAIMRLNMYCEGQAKVMVTSEINKGTEVKLILPILIWNE